MGAALFQDLLRLDPPAALRQGRQADLVEKIALGVAAADPIHAGQRAIEPSGGVLGTSTQVVHDPLGRWKSDFRPHLAAECGRLPRLSPKGLEQRICPRSTRADEAKEVLQRQERLFDAQGPRAST